MSTLDFDVVTGPSAPPAQQNGEEHSPATPALPEAREDRGPREGRLLPDPNIRTQAS